MEFPSISLSTCLVILFATAAYQSIPLRAQQSAESFIQNKEEFIPSHEWQTVKDGQAVPPGLHIRLNLQTGVREAKLLEDAPSKKEEHSLIAIEQQPNETKSRENLQRAFAKLNLSADDVQTTDEHVEEVRRKYRSYEELKKDFASMQMKIETDQEIVTNLIDRLAKTDDVQQLKTILTDLEYYLHQYDNAVLFADRHGLELLQTILNSTETDADLRYLAALSLGAAFQGNPKVQTKGLNLGFVQCLSRLLTNEVDQKMRLRLLFSLSTLLRNFPDAQRTFVEHGGVETLTKVFEQTTTDSHNQIKIKLRVIQMINDLTIEEDPTTENKIDTDTRLAVRHALAAQDWCSRLSAHLLSIADDDFDQIDKTLLTMMPLADVCRMDFVALQHKLDQLNDVYTKMNPNEDSSQTGILIALDKLRQINGKPQSLSASDL